MSTTEDTSKDIGQIKDDKVAKLYCVSAEVVEYEIAVTAKVLRDPCKNISEEGQVSTDRKKGCLVKIPEKVDW